MDVVAVVVALANEHAHEHGDDACSAGDAYCVVQAAWAEAEAFAAAKQRLLLMQWRAGF